MRGQFWELAMAGVFYYLKRGFKTILCFENWTAILWSHVRPTRNLFIAKLRNGTRFRIRPRRGDDYILREIFVDKVYQRCLDHLSAESSVVIDVGANIGGFSILAAQRNHGLKVYAYEPFAENFRLLKENILLNGLDGRIYAFQCAVGAEKRTKTVFLTVASGASSMYESRGQPVALKVVTLCNIFVDNCIQKCHLLKIDCEGSEYEILYSTPREVLAQVQAIGMEFHEQFGTGAGEEMRAFLEDQGFQVDLRKGPPSYIYARRA
jgi:FkbM family methyltransferase